MFLTPRQACVLFVSGKKKNTCGRPGQVGQAVFAAGEKKLRGLRNFLAYSELKGGC